MKFSRERTAIAKILLKHGAQVNGIPAAVPLIYAAQWVTDPEFIRMLLEAGADINAQNVDGDTALSLAAERGNKPTIKLLFDHNARTDIKLYKGRTIFEMLNNLGDWAMLEYVKNWSVSVMSEIKSSHVLRVN